MGDFAEEPEAAITLPSWCVLNSSSSQAPATSEGFTMINKHHLILDNLGIVAGPKAIRIIVSIVLMALYVQDTCYVGHVVCW